MKNNKAFTIVELIVVITILSVLATIGFVSFGGYLAGTRDTNRISQLKSMSDALELYRTKKDLPIPDDKVDVQASGTTIAYQGYIGANVLETIEYTEKGLDPKDKKYFSYYLTKDKKFFQLMSFLEEPSEDVVASNNIFNSTRAVDYSGRYGHVKGKKLGILTDGENTPIQEITTITSSGYLDIADVGATEYQAIISDEEIVSGSGTSLSSTLPNGSCKRIKQIQGGSSDGVYTIDPEGDGTGFEVYCDMTTDGGGWTYATMLADQTTQNLFDTGNTTKITSITNNVSTKGTISNVWLDNEDKDIMLICKTTSNTDAKKFEIPFIVYSFQKQDIGNLEKATKQGTAFSSQSLTAEWNGNKYQLNLSYAGASNSNSFYLNTSGGRVYTLASSSQFYISSSSSFNDSPAYTSGSNISPGFDTSTYCMSAIR